MLFYVDLALTWILFLALFPTAGFWAYRAYRIGVKRDFSLVALKRGLPTARPEKFWLFDTVLHLSAALLLCWVIYGIVFEQWPYDRWTAVAGITIWCKVLFSFVMSRHAHPSRIDLNKWFGRK